MEITNCNKLIRKNKIVDDANDLTNGQFGINGYKDSRSDEHTSELQSLRC